MSKNRGCLWVVIAFCVLTVLCCCGGVLVGPGLFMRALVQPAPLSVPQVPPDEDADVEVAARIVSGEAVRVTPAEITRLLNADPDEDIAALAIGVADGDALTVDVSMREPGAEGYFNVHFVGEVEMVDGRMTRMTPRELDLGAIPLGGLLQGQDLSDGVNRNLAQQAATDPELAANLRAIRLFRVEDGALIIQYEPQIDELGDTGVGTDVPVER